MSLNRTSCPRASAGGAVTDPLHLVASALRRVSVQRLTPPVAIKVSMRRHTFPRLALSILVLSVAATVITVVSLLTASQ